MSAGAVLELRGLTKRFEGIVAVDHLDVTVTRGAIHGVIGPNGSGKSTLFNLIGGLFPPTSGSIRFAGKDITGLRAHEVAAGGISRTFQATTVFPEPTVAGNVVLASHLSARRSLLDALLWTGRYRRAERAIAGTVAGLLRRLRLDAVADHQVRNLSQRDQKMVSVANALATGAHLLMLDEPMAGLSLGEKEEAADVIRWMRDSGRTVLLVEHDIQAVMELCDTITVLDHGVKIGEGTPGEVQDNARVIEAYLGEAVR